MKNTKLTDIVIDAGTQIRVELDKSTIEEYKEAYVRGDKLPPLEVFVSGKRRILADGFHRYNAAMEAGLTELSCNLHEGSAVDAIKFALGANATHGLKRTNADKNNAVTIALRSFPEMTNRAIAELCAVASRFVDKLRKQEEAAAPPAPALPPAPTVPPSGKTEEGAKSEPPPVKKTDLPEPPKRTGRDGKKYSSTRTPKVKATPDRLDQTGYKIPSGIVALWDSALELQGHISNLGAALNALKKAEKENDVRFAECNFNSTRAELNNAITDFELVIPFAICPTCSGDLMAKCKTCKERGYVSKFFWDSCVPEETKQVREQALAQAELEEATK